MTLFYSCIERKKNTHKLYKKRLTTIDKKRKNSIYVTVILSVPYLPYFFVVNVRIHSQMQFFTLPCHR